MNKLLYILLIGILFVSCKSRKELEFEEFFWAEKYIPAAILCSENDLKKYKDECKQSLDRSVQEIESILSQKMDVPYSKLIVSPEKSKSIEELLKKNIHLSLRYGSIWKESVQSN